jgi:cytochrome b
MSNASYPVWDLPTRLFHWLLTLGVLGQWASAEWNLLSMDWHFRIGYALLALVLFRLAWGFVGSDSARFSRFVHGPAAVARYLPGLFSRGHDAQAGHNPLGGWAVLLLLGVLLAQSITGLFSTDDISLYGPLAERVSSSTASTLTTLHRQLTDVLVVLIALHLVGVAFHALYKREPLVGAMFTGRKRLPADPALRFAGVGRAVAVIAGCAGVVWAVVTWGAG